MKKSVEQIVMKTKAKNIVETVIGWGLWLFVAIALYSCIMQK